jgi:signal transduction histidine kinase
MTPRNGIPELHGRQRHQPSTFNLRREIERLSARVAELESEKADLESFAAVAAHELMEPLVMTEAYTALVSERLDEEHADSRRDLETIGRGAARTRMLLETILDDARLADREPRMEAVALDEIVADSLDLLAPEIRQREAEIQVEALPVVRGEGVLLSSVINNLLVNALKYSPRRDGRIRIQAEREGEAWKISVASAGPTLAPDERERIFAQFNRGRGERRARGTGLGLAICRRIVERHGGTIGVTAVNGSGNRFYFTLPAA